MLCFFFFNRNGGLQRENGELKAGLRAARRRAKDLEDTLRSKHELDLNRSVDNSEVISLHKEVQYYTCTCPWDCEKTMSLVLCLFVFVFVFVCCRLVSYRSN